MKITISKTIEPKPHPKDGELGFGKYATDHMFLMDYEKKLGWYNPRIVPYHELYFDPMAMCLHYGQEIFEGLKAYRCCDGGIALFRAEKNLERLNASARRMVMPEIDTDFVLNAIKKLIVMDQAWIPRSKNASLYIRPTLIATEAALGVRPSNRYLFFVILNPVGAYYAEGFGPIRIFISCDHTRAAQGGIGEAKTACNYGGTLLAYQEAVKMGFTQVLWLDAKEKKYVEEVGNSNIFFVFEGKMVTPALNGTILHGITRDTVIHLAQHMGLKVLEQPVAVSDIISGCVDGSLQEMFASGTAAVISPVGVISYKGEDYTIGDGKVGPVAARLYDEITNIQYGRKPEAFGWHQPIY